MFDGILEHWKLGTVAAVEPTSESSGKTWFVHTTSGESFVLKVSDLTYAEREHEVRLALSETEIPLAVNLLTSDGNWYVDGGDGQACCLYRRLPGCVISDHYTGDAARRATRFGEAIGVLHRCLSSVDGVALNREMKFVQQIQEWAIPTIGKHGSDVDFLSRERQWENVEASLVLLQQETPSQMIHRDAHPSNMLFAGGELTGFLDFEMVTRGLRVFDVCYCGSALLVEGFDEVKKRKQWPELFQSLLQGYQTYRTLDPLEQDAIYGMLIAIELIFMAFWLDNKNVIEAKRVERLLSWLKKHKEAVGGLKRD